MSWRRVTLIERSAGQNATHRLPTEHPTNDPNIFLIMPRLELLNSVASSIPDPMSRVWDGGQCAIPIFSFGDPTTARVATIGLNPSDREFLETATKTRLAQSRFANAWLTSPPPYAHADVIRIQADCNDYFLRPTYYAKWFGPMEKILSAASTSGLSYFTGTACHLDLTPWATDPTWDGNRALPGLPQNVKSAHIADGLPVLLEQLGFPFGVATNPRNSSIEKLVLNGATVVEQVLKVLGPATSCTVVQKSLVSAGGNKTTLKIFQGKLLGIDYVGWNIPIGQAFGGMVGRHVAQLSRRVKIT
jgi:hypothetical protein